MLQTVETMLQTTVRVGTAQARALVSKKTYHVVWEYGKDVKVKVTLTYIRPTIERRAPCDTCVPGGIVPAWDPN